MPTTFWGAVELFIQASLLGIFIAFLLFFFLVGVQQTYWDYREARARGEWDPWR